MFPTSPYKNKKSKATKLPSLTSNFTHWEHKYSDREIYSTYAVKYPLGSNGNSMAMSYMNISSDLGYYCMAFY